MAKKKVTVRKLGDARRPFAAQATAPSVPDEASAQRLDGRRADDGDRSAITPDRRAFWRPTPDRRREPPARGPLDER